MNIRNLSTTPLTQIVDCLVDSFADYFVKMPADPAFWERRWKAARADFRYSYGMFDEGNLVGFMIHGVDEIEGLKTAFNTGTGVLPSHRGQRIVKQLYEFAIPEFKTSGIQKCSLEVIQENEKAIKAYQSVGFNISKSLRCFNGEIKPSDVSDFTIEQLSIKELNWADYPAQTHFAWDYHKNGLILFQDLWQCFEVFSKQRKIGYFIIYPKNGTLSQFHLFVDDKDNWFRLFAAIRQISPIVKIANIDDRQTSKIKALENASFKNFINQYEMEVFI